ncbi:Hypothetical protein GbCGDNIH9_8552 [Granulibacter bethesdensis]|uniref:Uncharacterized protein n=1 Tax=Granulibacter bethesdensis TaxID=364410 RepID=A0AAC9P8J4_9PROT|nr:Hypothetical protein GbCGDNIH9_8552 [Granulibacter bethesdensis]APH62192.1 Hypothetical protein GbCGDNIH8_8552 [Granulibacter bethesdensis]
MRRFHLCFGIRNEPLMTLPTPLSEANNAGLSLLLPISGEAP